MPAAAFFTTFMLHSWCAAPHRHRRHYCQNNRCWKQRGSLKWQPSKLLNDVNAYWNPWDTWWAIWNPGDFLNDEGVTLLRWVRFIMSFSKPLWVQPILQQPCDVVGSRVGWGDRGLHLVAKSTSATEFAFAAWLCKIGRNHTAPSSSKDLQEAFLKRWQMVQTWWSYWLRPFLLLLLLHHDVCYDEMSVSFAIA